jgi:hypothetical protein
MDKSCKYTYLSVKGVFTHASMAVRLGQIHGIVLCNGISGLISGTNDGVYIQSQTSLGAYFRWLCKVRRRKDENVKGILVCFEYTLYSTAAVIPATFRLSKRTYSTSVTFLLQLPCDSYLQHVSHQERVLPLKEDFWRVRNSVKSYED